MLVFLTVRDKWGATTIKTRSNPAYAEKCPDKGLTAAIVACWIRLSAIVLCLYCVAASAGKEFQACVKPKS